MRAFAEREPAESYKGGNEKRAAAIPGLPGRREHAEHRNRAGQPCQQVERGEGAALRQTLAFGIAEMSKGHAQETGESPLGL